MQQHEFLVYSRGRLSKVSRAKDIQDRVREWATRTKMVHDTQATLTFMMACNALSTDAQVNALLDKHDTETVKRVVSALSGLFHRRQIIQEWGNPATDIRQRGDAWIMFVNGVEMLSGQQRHLDQYFSNCLAHDKGYGQIHSATQTCYQLASGPQQQSFDTVLRLAFTEPTNGNIWVGGQLGDGTYAEQLKRGFKLDSKVPVKTQEEMMWGRIVSALIVAENP